MKNNSTKLFVFGMLTTILLIVGGYFGWKLLTPGSVNFQIESPKEVKAGEVQKIKFICENNTRLVLSNSQIKIQLPKNAYDQEYNASPIIIWGDIAPKEIIEKEIDVNFFGLTGDKLKVNSSFEYKPQGFSSVFKKDQNFNVLINGSTFNLNISGPNQVLPETNFDMNVMWNNQSQQDFEHLALKLNYPEEFNFSFSDQEVIRSGNNFDLGFVKKLEQGNIKFSGSMGSQGGENKKFEALVGINLEDKDEFLVIGKAESVISLVSNPLNLDLLINERSVYSASLGETLNILAHYKNNYGVPLNNMVLKVVFEGDYFNYKKLLPNKGYFTFGNKTITWNEVQIPAFTTLNPGQEGNISFSIPISDNFDVKTFEDKNVKLGITATLESLTPPIGLEDNSKIKATSSATVKINAGLSLEISGFFKDNKTTISNCGTLPLKVGEKTCYTVHMKVKNYLNAVNDIIVTTDLPYYANYTNKYSTSYTNANFTFDTFSKKLIWKLDSLPANSGVISKPYELIFQVEVTPTISEANQAIPIINQTNISAVDSFTQNKINKAYSELMSNKIYDATLNSSYGRVQE
jgi:hypothetical protein